MSLFVYNSYWSDEKTNKQNKTDIRPAARTAQGVCF